MNLALQKYFVLFFLIFAFSGINAQTIEEEVSKKSCECIRQKLSENQQISQNEIKKCISKSGEEMLKSKDQREVKKIMGNMERLAESLKIVYKNISENCLPRESLN